MSAWFSPYRISLRLTVTGSSPLGASLNLDVPVRRRLAALHRRAAGDAPPAFLVELLLALLQPGGHLVDPTSCHFRLNLGPPARSNVLTELDVAVSTGFGECRVIGSSLPSPEPRSPNLRSIPDRLLLPAAQGADALEVLDLPPGLDAPLPRLDDKAVDPRIVELKVLCGL